MENALDYVSCIALVLAAAALIVALSALELVRAETGLRLKNERSADDIIKFRSRPNEALHRPLSVDHEPPSLVESERMLARNAVFNAEAEKQSQYKQSLT